MPEEEIGKVASYFSKIGVAAIDITKGVLKVGDKIHIRGHTTDVELPFEQIVESIQIEHQNVPEAKPGDSIGIKVKDKVRDHDIVYKVLP